MGVCADCTINMRFLFIAGLFKVITKGLKSSFYSTVVWFSLYKTNMG